MGKLLPNSAKEDLRGVPGESVGSFVESVSASVRAMEAIIRELAQSDVPVLLLAEPGSGKHATARRIHEMSRRSADPFRWLQCSTLKPKDLDVPQGDEEGSLRGGTIFLEELADLSLNCQTHLQDALPQGTGGGSGEGGARFICGSARDLEVEVKAGRLREDLYYRVSGVCLRLPPLRQRKEDILLLMGHFLRKYAQEFRRAVPELSTETQRLFQDYSWPGNLRELEDAARVLVALGDEQLAMGGLRALLHKPAGGNGGGISLKTASRAASHEAEKELILNALTRTRWNRRRAAADLRISYKALLYKLKQIGYEEYGAS
jgi:two-component system, NtrC family, response regulator AtoC